MRTITIDCAGVGSIDAFWQRYLDATQPEAARSFGRNLDAFWDAIEAGGPGWPGEAKLVFRNSAALGPFTNRGGTRPFLDCLKEIGAKATAVAVEFA